MRPRFMLVEPDRAGLLALGELVDAGKLRVEMSDRLPLAEAARAHRLGEPTTPPESWHSKSG